MNRESKVSAVLMLLIFIVIVFCITGILKGWFDDKAAVFIFAIVGGPVLMWVKLKQKQVPVRKSEAEKAKIAQKIIAAEFKNMPEKRRKKHEKLVQKQVALILKKSKNKWGDVIYFAVSTMAFWWIAVQNQFHMPDLIWGVLIWAFVFSVGSSAIARHYGFSSFFLGLLLLTNVVVYIGIGMGVYIHYALYYNISAAPFLSAEFKIFCAFLLISGGIELKDVFDRGVLYTKDEWFIKSLWDCFYLPLCIVVGMLVLSGPLAYAFIYLCFAYQIWRLRKEEKRFYNIARRSGAAGIMKRLNKPSKMAEAVYG